MYIVKLINLSNTVAPQGSCHTVFGRIDVLLCLKVLISNSSDDGHIRWLTITKNTRKIKLTFGLGSCEV